MYVIREVMHCKPGQVRPLVEKFKQLEEVMKQKGFGQPSRIMTDVSGERYWTLVSEQEVEDLDAYAEMSRQTMSDPDVRKVMEGYHDFVEDGRREIYRVEA